MKSTFQDGQVVLFQGDSITDCSRDRSDITSLGKGYGSIVAKLYQTLFPEVKVSFVNKGVSGNRAKDLLERYEEDFKAIQPDYLSLLIGINDTWRRYDNNDPTDAEEFEKNCRRLLTQVKQDLPKCKLIMIEPFLLNSLPDRASWREDLDPKIHVIRKLAKEFADYYIPMDGIFAKYEAEEYTCTQLAEDGVHPSPIGHRIIAEEYLKLFLQ
ncbi:MAG: family lipase [Herbinix sp.]|jgi:lysophospholipase L1-like esterase|nr:family lipase [Herbinix sp.]